MRETNFAWKIWNILYPLLTYYATIEIVLVIARSYLGRDSEHYMICQILASLVCIPVMFFGFYRQDMLPKFVHAAQTGVAVKVLVILVISFCVGTGLNNILLMSPLVQTSAGFQEAQQNFYGSSLAVELFGSAFLIAILEELVFRGILYQRLKRLFQGQVLLPAVISSLLFGLLHFNVVQFVFAFTIGMIFVAFVEETHHVYGSIIGHMCINALSIVRTELGLMKSTADKSTGAWAVSILLLVIGLAFVVIISYRGNNRQ